MNPHLRIHRNAAPHAGQWFVALALGAACSIGPGQLLQSDADLPQGPKYTACRNAVCLEVWNTNASCKLVRYVLCVSLPCPHSCNKWCLKTWHSTKVDITMKELGLFLYQTCGHIGDGLWQFMARFTRFCAVSLHVPTRPSQPLPQDPVRAAEWLQARIPRSQR